MGCTPGENHFNYDVECGFWDVPQREINRNVPYRPKEQYESFYLDRLKWDEDSFLWLAKNLREFIYFLERIYHENKYVPLRADYDGLRDNGKYIFIDEFIEEPSDLQAFKENPQAYTWEFELINSF